VRRTVRSVKDVLTAEDMVWRLEQEEELLAYEHSIRVASPQLESPRAGRVILGSHVIS
jgi:hypothetical protein